MTRLLLVFAACLAGVLGTNHGGNGAGEIAASPGPQDNGQAGDGSAGVQGLNSNQGEGKDETVKISINVIAKSQGGRAPTQFIGEPAVPPGKTHQVTVGGSAGLVYTPDSLAAEPGDIVQFNFLSKNHTVTQSAFAKPCVKLVDGVDSGFLANGDETTNPPPTYKFQVLDKKPLWFYCRQKGHCGKGMTFSINPTAEKSQAKFKQLAIEQNGAAGGANGGYASATGVSPPPAGTGVVAPSGTAPAASGAFPAPSGNSTAYTAPLQPPPQQNNGDSPPAPGATQGGNLVPGAGSTASGECSCSCFCGVSSFPAGAGVGAWGGIPGSVPA